MRRVLGWVGGIALLMIGLAAANLSRDPHAVDVDWQLFRPAPPVVLVGRPTPGPITRTVAAKGVIEPVHQAQVVAKVNGKVAQVCVEEGASVRKGDVLIKLDETTFRARVDAARTRLDTARTNLDKAEAHLRDLEKDPAAATAPANTAPPHPLAGIPGASTSAPVGPSRLEVARNSVEGWKRERKSAESADEAAQSDLDRAAIRAPIDGVVEELGVEVGDDVLASPTVSVLAGGGQVPLTSGLPAAMGMSPGLPDPRSETASGPGRALCRLLDPARLRVRAWIDEADVGLVLPNQPTQIFLPDEPAVPVRGWVHRVAVRGSPVGEVVSYPTIIELDDSTRQPKVGMRVNVEIEVSRKDSPLGVPVQAVMHRKQRDALPNLSGRSEPDRAADPKSMKAVFVLEGNLVRLRPIETGVSDERRVEVLFGIAADDLLVVGPFRALDMLEDGAVVRTEPDQAPAPGRTEGLTSLGRRPTR